MRKSFQTLSVVPMLLVIVAMAALGLHGTAHAEPVQQLGFRVSGDTPDQLTIHLHLRRFDTTGAVPPTPAAFELRLPAGVRINPAFLTARYRCDGDALRDALDAWPSGTPFNQRLTKLETFARELARSHAKRDRAALAVVRTCERARLGGGSGLIDARDAISILTDPIPFGVSIFLSRGTAPGAIAGLTAVGSADPQSAIVRRYPVIAGVHAVEHESLVSDPSPDGLFGLKLLIYTGPVNGFQLSRARVDVTVRSLVLRRGTCLARGREDHCVRRQRTTEWLFEVPTCQASAVFDVQLLAAYPPPTPSQTTTLGVPCPRYAP